MCWTFALYVIMALPRLAIDRFGVVASLHRWTLLNLLLVQAANALSTKLRLSPLVLIVLVLAFAPVFGKTTISGFTKRSESAWEQPQWLLLEPDFYGSPNGTVGSWLVLGGTYLIGFHYGTAMLRLLCNFLASIKERHGRRMVVVLRLTAAAAAIALVGIREVADVPVDTSLPSVLQDWPKYFDCFYPVRFLAEFVFAVLLVTALNEGCFLWNLIGANLLGFYVGHVFVKLDISKVVCVMEAGGYGIIFQILVLLTLPFMFGLVLGKSVFLTLQLPLLAGRSVAEYGRSHCFPKCPK